MWVPTHQMQWTEMAVIVNICCIRGLIQSAEETPATIAPILFYYFNPASTRPNSKMLVDGRSSLTLRWSGDQEIISHGPGSASVTKDSALTGDPGRGHLNPEP